MITKGLDAGVLGHRRRPADDPPGPPGQDGAGRARPPRGRRDQGHDGGRRNARRSRNPGIANPDPRVRSISPGNPTVMVDFFIRRPIFATVSALLMLLIGGICAFRLPIAQYPQIAPPQVQVTTTYTGADALSVARTVTTPIEQQINGTKGMIYYNSDSTSNGVSNIVATFDVGYSQDMAAVDIQNRVQTAQAQLPPEVKQYGVSIKKTSTDMVCVVNLISPDGRYDANFLDNYGQIYVADVLKRINGVSDANVLGRKYAMRIWIDPDRLANMKIAPTEVIQAIQQENVQAAAGKIGGRPVPTGQDFELPITRQGAAREGERVRGDHRPPGRRRLDRPHQGRRPRRAVVGELRVGQLHRRQAGRRHPDLPVRRRQCAEHHPHGPRGDGPPQGELPRRARLHDRLQHDRLRGREHQGGRAHAGRVVRPGHDRRVRVPPGVPRHDHPDAGDPGLAGRHVRGDGGLRLLDQLADALRPGPGDRPGGRRRDHRGRERREVPPSRPAAAGGHPRRDGRDHHADRDDHPGAGRRVRPGGLHAGDDREALQPVRDDDRLLVRVLGVQLALVQPGDVAAVPPREARRDPVLPVPLVQRGPALDREFLRRRPRMDGPPLVDDRRAVAGPAGAHRLDDRQPAQGVHPDRGPGLPDLRDPDARRHQRREDRRGHPARRGALPGRGGGRAHGRARRPERDHLDQPDQLRRRLRAAGRLARARRRRGSGPPAWPRSSRGRSPRSATPW